MNSQLMLGLPPSVGDKVQFTLEDRSGLRFRGTVTTPAEFAAQWGHAWSPSLADSFPVDVTWCSVYGSELPGVVGVKLRSLC